VKWKYNPQCKQTSNIIKYPKPKDPNNLHNCLHVQIVHAHFVVDWVVTRAHFVVG